MITEEVAVIPPGRAYFCVDCECTGNDANQCPACASEVLINISAVLNRIESVSEGGKNGREGYKEAV